MLTDILNKISINIIFYFLLSFFIFLILYITTRPDFNILVIGQSNSALSGQIDSNIPPHFSKNIFFRNKILIDSYERSIKDFKPHDAGEFLKFLDVKKGETLTDYSKRINIPNYKSAFTMQEVPLISYYFALNHFKNENRPIKIFSGGQGSTKIMNWSNKPTSIINNIFKIEDNKPNLIIWWQGESDAMDANFNEKSYKYYLNLLLEKIYVEYGEVPLIMIGLQKYEEENANWEKIRLIQKQFSERYNHVIYVETFDVTFMSLHPILDYKSISKKMYESYSSYKMK